MFRSADGRGHIIPQRGLTLDDDTVFGPADIGTDDGVSQILA
jgi:hypothetical protein